MNTYRTLKKYTHTKIKELKTVETNNSSPLVTAGAKLGESLRPEVKVTAVGRLDPGCPPPSALEVMALPGAPGMESMRNQPLGPTL